MKKTSDVMTRRRFVITTACGAGVIAGGVLSGWALKRSGLFSPNQMRRSSRKDHRLDYELSAYARIDPSLLTYRESGSFDTGLEFSRRIALTPEGSVLIAGERVLRVFERSGKPLAAMRFKENPHCMIGGDGGHVYVGFRDRVERRDLEGALVQDLSPLGKGTYLTSLALHGANLFFADAGRREVIVCDRNGQVQRRFGRRIPGQAGSGLIVPSPYFDLAVATDGSVHVANPGRHRMEVYTADGEHLHRWGRPSMSVEDFSGCCNPVHFTLLPGGGVATSEKGLARIKVYDSDGELQGVVAGPDQLVQDTRLAAQACRDCRYGFGYDLAADSSGRLLVLDPCANRVRVFERRT